MNARLAPVDIQIVSVAAEVKSSGRKRDAVVGAEVTSDVQDERREIYGAHGLPHFQPKTPARHGSREGAIRFVADQSDGNRGEIDGGSGREGCCAAPEKATDVVEDGFPLLSVVGVALDPDVGLHTTCGGERIGPHQTGLAHVDALEYLCDAHRAVGVECLERVTLQVGDATAAYTPIESFRLIYEKGLPADVLEGPLSQNHDAERPISEHISEIRRSPAGGIGPESVGADADVRLPQVIERERGVIVDRVLDEIGSCRYQAQERISEVTGDAARPFRLRRREETPRLR